MVFTAKIPTDRVIDKLDYYLSKKDFDGAKRHLNYWLSESRAICDGQGEILVLNELMGLSRKLGEKENALEFSRLALKKIDDLNISDNIGSATTYLNSATVYKAFGKANESISLFEKAKDIYENNLSKTDARLGGLYNNYALALVDLGNFSDAENLYDKAISVMEKVVNGEGELAITYLNKANAVEYRLGIEDGKDIISEYIERAKALLESISDRTDGGYAFILEKCASVFLHYGYDEYVECITARYRGIYERA